LFKQKEGEEMNQPVIQLENLTKQYGATRALDGLQLEVQQGELFGLVGVNGAGKTTTLSIIMGFIQTSSGTASVLGLDPWRDAPALHSAIAWLPGDVRLPDALSGLEWLGYQASVANLDQNQIPALASEWEVPLNRPMRTLSKGNRQKVALLRLLLAKDAKLLVLDEPTSGLDPVAQERLLLILRERAKAGATVFFSSHSLSEVQTLCDRVAVIDRGKVLKLGTLNALTGDTHTLNVWTQKPVDLAPLEPWKPRLISPTHVILEGDSLLEDALPKLMLFGIERAEFGGMSLEHLLEQNHRKEENQ
jgi:ABC-2 type transport system ATP-binding protein